MGSEAVTINRRESIRLSRVQRHRWQLRIDGDALITKNISNLSATGLAFKAPVSATFRVGQILKFTLSLAQDHNFDCEGEIVWTKNSQDSSGSMQQFGVRFFRHLRELSDSILVEKKLILEESLLRNYGKKIAVKKKMTFRYFVLIICGTLALTAMTAAFAIAVYLHK